MIHTNQYNLPAPLVNALTRRPRVPREKRISVTSLIKNPRQRLLEERHDEEITVDVSDNVWMAFGSALHQLIADHADVNDLSEEKLIVNWLGWDVVGVPDLYTEDGIVWDFKTTKAFGLMLGDKPDWEAQLNIYAHMLRDHGFEVSGLRIMALVKDWSDLEASRKADYPKAPTVIRQVPLWHPANTQRFILDRLSDHQSCQDAEDDDLPHCSEEERWARPDTWAVMKQGNKRALRVLTSEEQAECYIHGHKDEAKLYPKHRPGESIRCQRFCNAAPFCNQWQHIQGKEIQSPVGAVN